MRYNKLLSYDFDDAHDGPVMEVNNSEGLTDLCGYQLVLVIAWFGGQCGLISRVKFFNSFVFTQAFNH